MRAGDTLMAESFVEIHNLVKEYPNPRGEPVRVLTALT